MLLSNVAWEFRERYRVLQGQVAFSGLLIEGIKAQQAQLEALQAEVESLKAGRD